MQVVVVEQSLHPYEGCCCIVYKSDTRRHVCSTYITSERIFRYEGVWSVPQHTFVYDNDIT